MGVCAPDKFESPLVMVPVCRVAGQSEKVEAELPELSALVSQKAIERVVEYSRYQLPHDQTLILPTEGLTVAVPLLESEAPKDPLVLFDRWFRHASEAGALQPEAVTLATATPSGTPSARMVLFKGLEHGAFVFYSNYTSRKGRELALNNRAALVFFWSIVRHQVRVSGTVRRLSRAASAEYFHSRPRGAQISALASRQSRVVASRAILEKAVVQLAARYPGEVPLPPDWGGYALTPRWIEFWENREDRLHDRLRYTRQGAAWRIERLSP